MEDMKVNVVGETCPVPLIETRKALRKADPGQIVEVTGTHRASLKEIPMAAREMGLEVVAVEEKGVVWKIRIKK